MASIDPLKGVSLPQPWRGWFERLRTAANDAATKVSGMTEGNVFVADADGDLKDSGVTLPANTSTIISADYVGERYITEKELPEAGTEEGARYGSFRIGLLTEDDYAFFDENGKLIFYGITGVQISIPLNDSSIPTKFAVFDSTGNLKYRTAEQLADDLSGYLATKDYGAETFITENLLEEAGTSPEHDITSVRDHASDATSGQMLKADTNGLPVDASNTDAQVATAVTIVGTTLTDHGVLLGSGTAAITPMAVLGAGEIIVGVAAADPHALSAGATTTILVGGGAADPIWTTATGSGAPVRATSPTLVTPLLGTPTSGTLTNCTGLPQAAVVGLTTADSPVFATVKLSGLTDDYIPYHVSDAAGLANGPTKTNVDSAVSLKHTQGTDTALGAVGTKNPPIDADLALYRDSAASNVLVTSTWTQVKAFLKTYFDTLYHIVGGTDVPVTDGGSGASTLTDHGVLVGSGTDPITALVVGTNGQVLVGSTGADPVFATITDGEGIDTTLGAGTLSIAAETASETNPGVIEIATDVETIAGSDTARAITAANLKAKLGTQTDGGLLVGAGQTAAVEALAAGATTEVLVGGGVGVNPVWTTATGTGAPVRATSPALVTPALGTPSSGTLTSCTGLPQAGVVGLTSGDSPTFVTVKLSGLTDLKIPKHVADATGLADTTITVSANNEVTNASQPSFLARPTAQLSDVTGDGTDYTVVFATEIFDQNADFDGTSTFTAPVTGRYLLSFNLYILGLVAGHNVHQTGLITSNRGFWFNWNFAAGANPFTYGERGHTVLVDMDAGDTAYVTYAVTGGALAVDISAQSYFSGYLVC